MCSDYDRSGWHSVLGGHQLTSAITALRFGTRMLLYLVHCTRAVTMRTLSTKHAADGIVTSRPIR